MLLLLLRLHGSSLGAAASQLTGNSLLLGLERLLLFGGWGDNSRPVVVLVAGECRSACFLLVFAAAEAPMAHDQLGIQVGVMERLKVRKLKYSV